MPNPVSLVSVPMNRIRKDFQEPQMLSFSFSLFVVLEIFKSAHFGQLCAGMRILRIMQLSWAASDISAGEKIADA